MKKNLKEINILGIDTSCDDTSIALIKVKNQKSFEILSNVVSSQVKLHAKYGGVYPFLAKREHQKNLPLVFRKATKNINLTTIDSIGVTRGPGLEPCLWQGINFAKDLANKLKKPLIPVNHIEAHIIANFLTKEKTISQLLINFYPAVCLVVSGGHTQLILVNSVTSQRNLARSQSKQISKEVKGIGKYRLIGETRDDAAGECLDKTARILGLGYPGGPAIAAQARKAKKQKKTNNHLLSIKLPRPMMYSQDYDFSFSGLKTAVLYDFKKRPENIRSSSEYIQAMSQEIQQSIIDVLISKTMRAAKNFKAKTIILGGGVAANEELRKQFRRILARQREKLNFLVPEKKLCTDNGAMVAATAFFHRKEKWDLLKIKADANLICKG